MATWFSRPNPTIDWFGFEANVCIKKYWLIGNDLECERSPTLNTFESRSDDSLPPLMALSHAVAIIVVFERFVDTDEGGASDRRRRSRTTTKLMRRYFVDGYKCTLH